MKYIRRIFNIIHTEEVKSPSGKIKVRVCAITDPEKYRLARLNDSMPVRIEKQLHGNTYEVVQKCKSIATAQEMLPDIISAIRGGVSNEDEEDVIDFWESI